LDHPNDDRALAAFEMVSASDEAAGELAKELLDKSGAAFVEVWSDGCLVLRMTKAQSTDS
jgi:hypothetical protein